MAAKNAVEAPTTVTTSRAKGADAKTMSHVHESPKVMLIPLILLATGAVFAGWLGYDLFVGEGREGFWGDAIQST